MADGLIYKIKSIGIIGVFLKSISLLENRFQRVALLNGQPSSWEPVLPGVLWGSVLGTLFFLIYIN